MSGKYVGAFVVVMCAALLSTSAFAASDGGGHSFDKQCPAAAKWIAAYKHAHPHVKNSGDVTHPSQPHLRDALAKCSASDQKAREFMGAGHPPDQADLDQLKKVDADNLAWLKPLVAKQGFPTVAAVGKQGVADAWLLVQHADTDLAFQTAVLTQLTPRLGAGGIEKKDYALLTDRVRVNRGKKQLYGSQISARNGKYVMDPTEDVTHLAQRRESMNLLPMDDYLCVIRASYGPPPKAK